MTTPGSDPLRTSTGQTGQTGTPGTPTGPAATGPATTSRTTPERSPVRRAGRTAGRTLALALLLFVTVVLVLFVVYNNQTVQISLVFTDIQAPLVLALVIAAALGGLLVGLAGLVLRARRRS
ncbi:lipopolysaccharide assembly protein LapA domain-containing protein [Geodermatophilus sp. SYSU D01176]